MSKEEKIEEIEKVLNSLWWYNNINFQNPNKITPDRLREMYVEYKEKVDDSNKKITLEMYKMNFIDCEIDIILDQAEESKE